MRNTLCVIALAALALGASACGGGKKAAPVDDGTATVKRVSFVIDSGWIPSWGTRSIVLDSGAKFQALVSKVPRPLPPPAKKRPARVCIPAMLTIDLSNSESFDYASCQRPKSMRPVLRSLCKQIRPRKFCDRYRAELGLPPVTS